MGLGPGKQAASKGRRHPRLKSAADSRSRSRLSKPKPNGCGPLGAERSSAASRRLFMMRPTSARASFEIDSATFLGEGQNRLFPSAKEVPPGVGLPGLLPSESLLTASPPAEQATPAKISPGSPASARCGAGGCSCRSWADRERRRLKRWRSVRPRLRGRARAPGASPA
jgi:hypothetical protein